MSRLPRPIVVVGIPRSGTSLVAGLLHHHGVWVGSCRSGRDAKHPESDFVNAKLSQLLGKIGSNTGAFVKDAVWDTIKADGYCGGPWLVKQKVQRWPVLAKLDPYFVCVRRNFDAVYQSQMRVVQLKNKCLTDRVRVRRRYQWANRCMDRLCAEFGAINVSVDNIMSRGDFHGLKRVLEKVELEFSVFAVDRFVERGYWHFDDSIGV